MKQTWVPLNFDYDTAIMASWRLRRRSIRIVVAMRIRFGLLLLIAAFGLVAQDQPIFNEDVGIVSFEALVYPLLPKLTRVQGAVVVQVKIDSEGKVASATAVSGPKQLIPDCLTNARQWLFNPRKARTVVIVYVFKIEGLCKNPCSSSFSFSPPNLATIVVGEAVIQQ
jgi:Gram-negative bacterial TonB protein C-terminal